MNVHKLSDRLSACALVRISDLGAIHAAGFRSIISNRLDAEDLGQPSSHDTRAVAQEARHQSIIPGAFRRRAVVLALENDG